MKSLKCPIINKKIECPCKANDCIWWTDVVESRCGYTNNPTEIYISEIKKIDINSLKKQVRKGTIRVKYIIALYGYYTYVLEKYHLYEGRDRIQKLVLEHNDFFKRFKDNPVLNNDVMHWTPNLILFGANDDSIRNFLKEKKVKVKLKNAFNMKEKDWAKILEIWKSH